LREDILGLESRFNFLLISAPRPRLLTPIILATQEAEIRRIVVQSQPNQIFQEILSQITLHKNRAGGLAQGESPEFKPQYRKKKKKNLCTRRHYPLTGAWGMGEVGAPKWLQ
jgi:hypothetical protein